MASPEPPCFLWNVYQRLSVKVMPFIQMNFQSSKLLLHIAWFHRHECLYDYNYFMPYLSIITYIKGLCIQLSSLCVFVEVLSLKTFLFWLKNASLYQDIWSDHMTEMTFSHCSHPRKVTLTSFDTHCSPASFQFWGYAFTLTSYRDLNSLQAFPVPS